MRSTFRNFYDILSRDMCASAREFHSFNLRTSNRDRTVGAVFSLIESMPCSYKNDESNETYLCLGVDVDDLPGVFHCPLRVWVSTPPSNVSPSQRLAEKTNQSLLSAEHYN